MSVVAIADTGLLVAYLDVDDQHHDWAVGQFERFPFFETCEAVMAEMCYLAACELGSAARAMALLSAGAVRIGYDLRGDEARVEALVETYADRLMDFADACACPSNVQAAK